MPGFSLWNTYQPPLPPYYNGLVLNEPFHHNADIMRGKRQCLWLHGKRVLWVTPMTGCRGHPTHPNGDVATRNNMALRVPGKCRCLLRRRQSASLARSPFSSHFTDLNNNENDACIYFSFSAEQRSIFRTVFPDHAGSIVHGAHSRSSATACRCRELSKRQARRESCALD